MPAKKKKKTVAETSRDYWFKEWKSTQAILQGVNSQVEMALYALGEVTKSRRGEFRSRRISDAKAHLKKASSRFKKWVGKTTK